MRAREKLARVREGFEDFRAKPMSPESAQGTHQRSEKSSLLNLHAEVAKVSLWTLMSEIIIIIIINLP